MTDRLDEIKAALERHHGCPNEDCMRQRDDWLRWLVTELEQARADLLNARTAYASELAHSGEAGLGFLLACAYFGLKARRTWIDTGDLDDALPFVLPARFGLVLGLAFLCNSLPSFLTAWLAPRAYLIEYLR